MPPKCVHGTLLFQQRFFSAPIVPYIASTASNCSYNTQIHVYEHSLPITPIVPYFFTTAFRVLVICCTNTASLVLLYCCYSTFLFHHSLTCGPIIIHCIEKAFQCSYGVTAFRVLLWYSTIFANLPTPPIVFYFSGSAALLLYSPAQPPECFYSILLYWHNLL